MVLKELVETGFLLALNPKDKNHEWGMEVLKRARERESVLYISPAAPVELSLIMKSKGLSDRDIARVMNALEAIIRRYTKPNYSSLELRHVAYAAELRSKYPELTFFDSLHASVAILNNLMYADLDEVVREVVSSELGSMR